MSDPSPEAIPRPPQAKYTCPHCGGALDLGAIASQSTATSAPPMPTMLISLPAARLASTWLDRAFPIARSLGGSQPAANVPSRSECVGPRWIRWASLLAPLLLLSLWLLVPTVFGTSPPAASITPMMPMPTAARTALPLEHAALLAIVAQYNAADQQVAATLVLDPIRPFLDDTGPLLARRSQELARRKQTGASHAIHLLRWAVGALTIDMAGTTATLVTQETWENQESGDVAPQTATARVTYTLRRANPQAPWRIYDATSTIL